MSETRKRKTSPELDKALRTLMNLRPLPAPAPEPQRAFDRWNEPPAAQPDTPNKKCEQYGHSYDRDVSFPKVCNRCSFSPDKGWLKRGAQPPSPEAAQPKSGICDEFCCAHHREPAAQPEGGQAPETELEQIAQILEGTFGLPLSAKIVREAEAALAAERAEWQTLVAKYQCNPTGMLSQFEAIRNHLEVAHRTCNENYDWATRERERREKAEQERDRLKSAAYKVIDWNRQHAHDQYGDALKAESWACVKELRAAIAPTPEKEPK